MRVNYAIIFVSDMKRAVAFYRDVLGLPLKFESPGWTEFATDGATLALHAAKATAPARDDRKCCSTWSGGRRQSPSTNSKCGAVLLRTPSLRQRAA